MRAIDTDELKRYIVEKLGDPDSSKPSVLKEAAILFLTMVDNQPTLDTEDYIERPEINPNCNGLGHANCEICDSYCPYR